MSKDIKYKYAFNEFHEPISIDSINKENRNEHQFYCISCNKPLTPVLGQKKQHHFRHLEEIDCNEETYLHKLAKLLFKQKFEQANEINITRINHIICGCKNVCKMPINKNFCKESKEVIINLKNYFDRCTLEKGYNGFVADILLENSHNKFPPLMIEIAVTHPCSREKIKSKNPIFEITIENENDIMNMFNGNMLNGKKYNFKEYVSTSKGPLNIELPIQIFMVYKSGKYFSNVLHKRCTEQIHPDSKYLFQCIVYTDFKIFNDYYVNLEESVTLDEFVAIAQNAGFDIKSCNRCKFYKKNTYDSAKICTLYKKYQTPHHPNYLCAYGCTHYWIENKATLPNKKYYIINSELDKFKQIQNDLRSIYNDNKQEGVSQSQKDFNSNSNDTKQEDSSDIILQKSCEVDKDKRIKILASFDWNLANLDEQIKEEKTKALNLFVETFFRKDIIVNYYGRKIEMFPLKELYSNCQKIIRNERYVLKFWSQTCNKRLYIEFLTIDEKEERVTKHINIPLIYIVFKRPGQYKLYKESNGDIIIREGIHALFMNCDELYQY